MKNITNELIEIAVNSSLEKWDEYLCEKPIYEHFLPKKEQRIMEKMRSILVKIPKRDRIKGIKKYLENLKEDEI